MEFKFKDVFTAATIVIGFSAIPIAAAGNLHLASVLIIVGSFFDLADGAVARITRTSNRFGAEFDTVADLVIFSIAPGAIVYFALAPHHQVWAFTIGVLPVLFGSVRLARFNVHRVEFPGYWIGLTRPGVAAVTVSWINTRMFNQLFQNPLLASALIIGVVSALSVSYFPYPGHHNRSFRPVDRVALAIVAGIFLVAPTIGLFWEIAFLMSSAYVISPFFIPAEKRNEIHDFLRAWRKDQEEGESLSE